MAKEEGEDMRVEPVDGAPISLDKVTKAFPDGGLKVLVDRSHSGFVNDAAHLANITVEERKTQGEYFLSLNLPLPPYLKKYLSYLFECKDDDEVYALYKYAHAKKDVIQAIGFIQLVGSCFKHNMSAFIEEPETHFHPRQQAKIMTLFNMLKDDYSKKSPPVPPVPPLR